MTHIMQANVYVFKESEQSILRILVENAFSW